LLAQWLVGINVDLISEIGEKWRVSTSP